MNGAGCAVPDIFVRIVFCVDYPVAGQKLARLGSRPRIHDPDDLFIQAVDGTGRKQTGFPAAFSVFRCQDDIGFKIEHTLAHPFEDNLLRRLRLSAVVDVPGLVI